MRLGFMKASARGSEYLYKDELTTRVGCSYMYKLTDRLGEIQVWECLCRWLENKVLRRSEG